MAVNRLLLNTRHNKPEANRCKDFVFGELFKGYTGFCRFFSIIHFSYFSTFVFFQPCSSERAGRGTSAAGGLYVSIVFVFRPFYIFISFFYFCIL